MRQATRWCAGRWLWLLALAGLSASLALGAGCGAGSAPPRASGPAAAGLPPPSTVLRSATYLDRVRTQAANPYVYIGGGVDDRVVANGDQLQFNPAYSGGAAASIDQAARAGYLFPVDDYSGPPAVFFNWTTAPSDPHNLWLGLANRATDSWDWFQPADGVVTLPALPPYNEPGVGVLAAVILLGTEPAELAWIRLGPALWQTETVDASADVGSDNSLALDSLGRPHISYYNKDAGDLKYAHFDGDAWQLEVIDEPGDVGHYNSLALDSLNQPHVVYNDATAGVLKYAYRDGTGWHSSIAVGTPIVGTHCSLALDSLDHPHAAYFDWTALQVAYASFDGVHWSSELVGNGAADYITLALDADNRPHLAFNGTGGIRYATFNGVGWDSELVAADSGSPNGSRTIAVGADGVPIFGYYSYTDNQCYIARRTGGSWATAALPFGALLGSNLSLAVDGLGYPHLTCYGEGLEYVYEDPQGWHRITVDDQGWVGHRTSLALDAAGLAQISYYHPGDKILKYARQLTAF